MVLELSEEDQQLIERLKKRVDRDPEHSTTAAENSGHPSIYYPPVTYEQILTAEQAIGFPLPALIREIYIQVGNGGFGPGYGIIGLENGSRFSNKTLVETTLLSREYVKRDDEWHWQDSYLFYGYWGCSVYTIIDCNYLDLPIQSMDSMRFKAHSSHTLRRWWQDWLDDTVQQY